MFLVSSTLIPFTHTPSPWFFKAGFHCVAWLPWNSLCRPGGPPTPRPDSLCLLSAGITGVRHHYGDIISSNTPLLLYQHWFNNLLTVDTDHTPAPAYALLRLTLPDSQGIQT